MTHMTVTIASTPEAALPCQSHGSPSWRPFLVSLAGVTVILLGLAYAAANWEWPAGDAQGTHFQGNAPKIDDLPRRFRIGTFNIHGGCGGAGQLNLQRTADVIRGMDFVGLNEVRGGGWQDSRSQADQLGSILDLNWLFAPTEINWSGPHFGQGALTRLPVSQWKRTPFGRVQGNGFRNYVECQIPLDANDSATPLTILITHLDRKSDRQDQLRVIIQRFLEIAPPVILMGDLNSKRTEPQLMKLAGTPGVTDCFGRFAAGDFVRKRIDWMFVRGLNCIRASLEPTPSSDHPWGWAELEVSQRPIP